MKSVLHFDYPYYAENGDGLRDETGNYSWARNGSVKLVGSEIPADAIVSGTPKFGYRCLQCASTNDYISSSGSWTLNTSSPYEIYFWVRPTASQTGNLFALFNGSTQTFAISLTAEREVQVTSSALGLSLKTSTALALNVWVRICFQMSGTTCSIFIDNTLSASTSITRSEVSANQCRIGGAAAQIDEFVFKSSLSSSVSSITAPLQGTLLMSDIGGFGNAKHGNAVLSANGVFCTVAPVSKVSGKTLTTLGSTSGRFGNFAAGDEVMLINSSTGEYGFNTVSSFSVTSLLLTANPAISNPSFAVQVPNFNTLTVNAGVTMSGQYIAFRCKGDCTINGSLITMRKGLARTDSRQLTHAGLIDNFICGSGGGLFMTCGGTFTAPSTARIGATWSGAGKGGAPVKNNSGGNGGAGYGGAGGSDDDSGYLGGKGGVGGGGGGCDGTSSSGNLAGYDAGKPGSYTGGGFYAHDNSNSGNTRHGGAQGKTSGSSGLNGGGGGAGGNGTNDSGGKASAGANIILVAKTLKVDEAAISTGGSGGAKGNQSHECGGGGTGFCYIACERMI